MLAPGFSGFSPLSDGFIVLGSQWRWTLEHENVEEKSGLPCPVVTKKHKERPRDQEGAIDKTNPSKTHLMWSTSSKEDSPLPAKNNIRLWIHLSINRSEIPPTGHDPIISQKPNVQTLLWRPRCMSLLKRHFISKPECMIRKQSRSKAQCQMSLASVPMVFPCGTNGQSGGRIQWPCWSTRCLSKNDF